MATLLLHLHGPLQAWGPAGAGNHRSTLPHPTRSGVLGLLGCALGLPRGDERLGELDAAVSVAIRIEAPGSHARDYRTATVDKTVKPDKRSLPEEAVMAKLVGDRRTIRAKLTAPVSGAETKIGVDGYRQDARFTVGIGADPVLLGELAAALRAPRWPLFLGRRSCPAPFDLCGAILEEDPLQVLSTLEWQVSPALRASVREVTRSAGAVSLQVVHDATPGAVIPERISGGRVASLTPGVRRYRDWAVQRAVVSVPDRTTTAAADPFELDLSEETA
ncbi:type I-E CRISPR-associated protein Cas5/CasD [Pseudactinotalea terrae]|uniref:type I-E CRISPR-associated protein Cas5/CasD n=1 Tax=Pseudactinotalea terrae TaxID=1743262 RepID=UPI001390B545|nr:type I-E CRISPR-associated protein Cas5/CasD [Pseudactinotalea terrae]